MTRVTQLSDFSSVPPPGHLVALPRTGSAEGRSVLLDEYVRGKDNAQLGWRAQACSYVLDQTGRLLAMARGDYPAPEALKVVGQMCLHDDTSAEFRDVCFWQLYRSHQYHADPAMRFLAGAFFSDKTILTEFERSMLDPRTINSLQGVVDFLIGSHFQPYYWLAPKPDARKASIRHQDVIDLPMNRERAMGALERMGIRPDTPVTVLAAVAGTNTVDVGLGSNRYKLALQNRLALNATGQYRYGYHWLHVTNSLRKTLPGSLPPAAWSPPGRGLPMIPRR